MDLIDNKILCIFGPSRQLWSVSVIYETLLKKLGRCPAQGIGFGQSLFKNYLRNHPCFTILNHDIVRTNITDEQHAFLICQQITEENAQKVLQDVERKLLRNTSENSVISHLPNSESKWKFVLTFNLHSFDPDLRREIERIIQEKEDANFSLVLNVGFK